MISFGNMASCLYKWAGRRDGCVLRCLKHVHNRTRNREKLFPVEGAAWMEAQGIPIGYEEEDKQAELSYGLEHRDTHST